MTRPPRADEPVLIALSGGTPTHARVLRASATTLDVEVDVALPVRGRGDVVLEYVADEGVCRLLGQVRTDHDPHVVHVDHRGRAQLLQRAEVLSASVSVPLVALRLNDRDAVATRGVTSLLGGGGVVVRGVHGARPGDAYEIALELPDGGLRTARGQAKVARVMEAGSFEARWTKLSSFDRTRICRVAFEARRRGGRRAA